MHELQDAAGNVAVAAPAMLAEKVAIVLAAGLAPGPAANIAACIAAGLSAGCPGWAGRALTDAGGLQTLASSHLPITVLSAGDEAMAALVQRLADGAGRGAVSLFPAYAQAVHDCGAYWQRHGVVWHGDEPLLGMGCVGSKRWVNRLTGSLPLWR